MWIQYGSGSTTLLLTKLLDIPLTTMNQRRKKKRTTGFTCHILAATKQDKSNNQLYARIYILFFYTKLITFLRNRVKDIKNNIFNVTKRDSLARKNFNCNDGGIKQVLKKTGHGFWTGRDFKNDGRDESDCQSPGTIFHYQNLLTSIVGQTYKM